MNKIHSNIKKIALSLLVVGLVISTQAFKSTEKEVATKSTFATANYGYNITNERYELISGTPNTLLCETGGNKCVVIYTYPTTTPPTTPPAFISESEGDALPVYGDSPSSNAHYFD